MNRLFDKKWAVRGFSMLELIAAMSIIALLMALAIPTYSSYRRIAEKKVHVMNAKLYMTGVQNGLLEGWIKKPAKGTESTVTLQDLASRNYFVSFEDPSSSDKSDYAMSSVIAIKNNAGSIEFYIVLSSSSGYTYINRDSGKQISDLGSENVRLKQESN